MLKVVLLTCVGENLVSFLFDLYGVPPSDVPSKWYQSRWFVAVTGLNEYNLIPVSKVFLTKF